MFTRKYLIVLLRRLVDFRKEQYCQINEKVIKINDMILFRFNALTKVYCLVDTVFDKEERLYIIQLHFLII